MTPKQQLPCPSCAAFAILGALEAVINIRIGDPTIDADLSEQHVLSCIPSGPTCVAGYWGEILGFIMYNGVTEETCFPYTCPDTFLPCAEVGLCCGSVPCTPCPNWADTAWRITDCVQVDGGTTTDLQWALREYGPLVTLISSGDFMFYESGIYEPVLETEESPDGDHWVTLVGYDDPGGYWIVKNSFGPDWSEKVSFAIITNPSIHRFDSCYFPSL